MAGLVLLTVSQVATLRSPVLVLVTDAFTFLPVGLLSVP